MSILQGKIPGARVLDLFSGSGALALEALSRGAVHVDAVETSPRSLKAIKANADLLGAGDSLRVHRTDAVRFLDNVPSLTYDIAFADPPYGLGMAEKVAARWLREPFARVLGVEHSGRDQMPAGGDTRKYGDTRITFYRAED